MSLVNKSDDHMLLQRWSRGSFTWVPCWEGQQAMTLPSRHCYWANQSFWVQEKWQDFGSPKDGPPELGLLLDHSNPGWPLSFLSSLPHPSSRDTVSPLSSKRTSFVSVKGLHGTTVPLRPRKISTAFFLTLNIIWNSTFYLELIILQKVEVHW